jgi:type VI secretion system secreted protein VgrG
VTATQQHRLLAIGTALGDDALMVKNMLVSEQLGRLFHIETELRSEDTAVDFDQVVGTNATLRLEMPDGNTRYFNGYISRFVQTEQGRGYAHYRATLVPWLWLLTRTADCRIFQNQTAPAIIEAVFKALGFKDYKLSLSGSYSTREYCVQYRETDFNFVSRLMEQEGIYYFFEHDNGVHTMVLADAPSAHSAFGDYDTLTYRTRMEMEGDQTAESVTEWMIEKEVQPGVYALADFNFTTPASPIVVNANITRQSAAAGFEVFDYPGVYGVRGDGEAYAKVRIQELQARYEVLRGQATARGVCTGYKFTLKGHPRTDQNREYLVTGASIHASAAEFESSGKQSGAEFFSCSFTAIATTEQFRAARLTAKPLVQGPQTAFVVGTSGEEVETDQYGRVKVQFPWDRYGTADQNSSCWVRVSQACAGKGWGAISLPRIGQEVVVEFLEGDPDRPIVTGRVYNATNTVPYALPDNKTMSTFKSNSSKGGQGFNELRFEDKKGSEQIFIHGEKNLDIRIKNDAFETTEHDHNLVVGHDSFEHVVNNRNEAVDATHKEKIGADRNLNVVGKEAKAVGGSLSLTVSGDVIEVFKGNHSEQVTSDFYLKADNIVIEGMTNVTIKVGQSYIAIESGGISIGTNGTIELQDQQGLTIQSQATGSIQSTGAMSVQSSAALTVKGATVAIN